MYPSRMESRGDIRGLQCINYFRATNPLFVRPGIMNGRRGGFVAAEDFLSKSLTNLLRHSAEKDGYRLLPGGFLYLDDILKHRNFQSASVEDLQQIVKNSEKKRYTLETEAETGRIKIRANQGHSIEVRDLDLTPITEPNDYPKVLHGTYSNLYSTIAVQGLKRMHRNHIHFAPGEPGEAGVLSGMKDTCTVVIYLNLAKALQGGLKFYLSANNVILCPGNENGIIATDYFEKVIERRTGRLLYSLSNGPSNGLLASHSFLEQRDEPADKKAVTIEEIADE